MNSYLDEIKSAFEKAFGDGTTEGFNITVIPLDKFKVWMQSDDIDMLGGVVRILENRRAFIIEPKPPSELIDNFLLNYWFRCIKESPPENEWNDGGFAAGMSLNDWFGVLWEKDKGNQQLNEVKKRIEILYKEGDEGVRKVLIYSTLEHIFQNEKIVDYFADWMKDPELEKAFKEAAVVYGHYRKYYPSELGSKTIIKPKRRKNR